MGFNPLLVLSWLCKPLKLPFVDVSSRRLLILGQKVTSHICRRRSLPLQFPAIPEDVELNKKLPLGLPTEGIMCSCEPGVVGLTVAPLSWCEQRCSGGQQEGARDEAHKGTPKKPFST